MAQYFSLYSWLFSTIVRREFHVKVKAENYFHASQDRGFVSGRSKASKASKGSKGSKDIEMKLEKIPSEQKLISENSTDW